ncbi:MAG TPA: HAD family hydrolase [Dictyobacter sp.]|jgi:HAD superfamily hydrolase (TIGR01509 family)|nr:HAD family hydrolase [Dictyobacter sp.]
MDQRICCVRGVVLDIDGTLVDTNDAQAYSWVQAMHEYEYEVDFDTVRPLIGMGGDKVLPETLHIAKDSDIGQKISKRRKEIFKTQYLPRVHALPGAFDLLQHMYNRGLRLVIATSAEADELQGLLGVIGEHADQFFEKQTSSQDAQKSKPDADIMQVALQRSGLSAQELVMLGDTAYDIQAAQQVHIPTIAFRSGGWSDQDLQGAIAIYDDPLDLLQHFDQSPLANQQQHPV